MAKFFYAWLHNRAYFDIKSDIERHEIKVGLTPKKRAVF